MLFAQAGGFGKAGAGAGGGPPPGVNEGLLIAIGIGYLIFLAVMLAVGIMFLLTLSKCLQRCRPRNRTMEPGQVWLNLIPCFNIVWQFITVVRISESLHNEYRDRDMHRGEDYGKALGITALCLNWGGIIPYLGILLAIAALVCFIIYWVKIAGYSRDLAEAPSYGDDDDRNYRRRYDEDDRPRRSRDDRYDDDEDDDRPRRRQRQDDEDEDDDRGGYRRRYE